MLRPACSCGGRYGRESDIGVVNINTSNGKFKLILIQISSAVAFSIYLFFAAYYVLFFSSEVPEKNSLKLINIGSNNIACVVYESGKITTYNMKFLNHYNEAMSQAISKGKCIEVQTAIDSVEKVNVLVDDKPVRIFGNRWEIYQIEVQGRVLMSYEWTASELRSLYKKLYYGGLFVLLIFFVSMVSMARSLLVKKHTAANET